MTTAAGPPVAMLVFLKTNDFEEIELAPGVPSWWKRPGFEPVPWEQAAAQLVTALVKENTTLRDENAKLKNVTAKPGVLTTEFWMGFSGVVGVGVMAAVGPLMDLANALPPPWGIVLNVVVTGAVAAAGGKYVGMRRDGKEAEAAAKKAITSG